MKAETYIRHLKIKHGNDWYQVKPGAGAVAVEETTPTDVMHYAGDIHDMSVMDPAELLERFEEYEDPEFDGEEWGIL